LSGFLLADGSSALSFEVRRGTIQVFLGKFLKQIRNLDNETVISVH
jgi:hypothetical protein